MNKGLLSITDLLKTKEVANAFNKNYWDETSPISLGLKNLEICLGHDSTLSSDYSINGLCVGVNVNGADNVTFYLPKGFKDKLSERYYIKLRGSFFVYFEPKLGGIGLRATSNYRAEMVPV